MKTYKRQDGAALATVLILLLIVTLLGLMSLRGTLLQERMASAAFDRQLGFQQAESALRSAEGYIRTKVSGKVPTSAGYDCSVTGRICPTMPSNTYTASTSGCTQGTQNCWTSVAASTEDEVAGNPEYYVEYMGQRSTQDDENLGVNSNANAAQYGAGGGKTLAYYYRVTARSFDPTAHPDRSLVVLQSTIRVE